MQQTLENPRLPLQEIVARHGRWPTFRALMAVLIRPNRPPPFRPEDLNPHLRRDIGLDYTAPSPTWRDFM